MFLGGAGLVLGQDAPNLPRVEPGALALVPAQSESAVAVSANQLVAVAVADALKHSSQLRHYRMDIEVRNRVAELQGQVESSAQRDEVLRVVRSVNGVEQVVDRLSVVNGNVVPVQAQFPMPTVQPPAMAPMPGSVLQPPAVQVVPAQPGGIVPAPGMPQEPMSLVPMQTGPNPAIQPPPLPPYAWPTYAPYNNFSRVAGPTEYEYGQWPFIGPMYPYPKVPPGWRAVTLRWQDGYWWYGREASGHDWWRIRYW